MRWERTIMCTPRAAITIYPPRYDVDTLVAAVAVFIVGLVAGLLLCKVL